MDDLEAIANYFKAKIKETILLLELLAMRAKGEKAAQGAMAAGNGALARPKHAV
jgi:hypothetical protein